MPATPSFLTLRDPRIERPKPGACTFTAQMAKRATSVYSGGFVGDVFGAGVKIQGARYTGFDILTFPRGVDIDAPFYKHLDTRQGTLLFWIRPDWPGDDGLAHILFYDPTIKIQVRKNTDNTLAVYCNGTLTARASVDISGWTAFEKHLVIVRWDAHNAIDASNNHVCISVDDSHTFGDTNGWTPGDPAPTLYIGCADQDYLYHPADAIIEGFTLYRRVLYDGAHGIDAGNGDELALIYNSGDGAKPLTVTGRLDVVFHLPTDESPGVLSTGTGEAYSFPHDENLITGSPTAIGGGGGGTPTLTETGDPIYNQTGHQITAIDAIGDGIQVTYDCSGDPAGQNYLLPVWIKDDGTHTVTLRIHDATNSADITTAATAGNGTWERLSPNFNRPAGCNSLEITLEASDGGSGTITFLPPQLYTADTGTVPLDDVTLTVTPAPLDKSRLGPGIRVDGRDTCTQPSDLLTAVSGDLRFHFQANADFAENSRLYRFIVWIHHTTPSDDNRVRLFIMPIPWLLPSHKFNTAALEDQLTITLDAERHAYRIQWTPTHVSLWLDHQLKKRWTGSYAMGTPWSAVISWGHNDDDANQSDGWISP